MKQKIKDFGYFTNPDRTLQYQSEIGKRQKQRHVQCEFSVLKTKIRIKRVFELRI